jgi:predicted acylesterase/phospholipase RssA
MSSVERRPKVGVVLGSGGIKPFSAIALFEFLDEMGIVVDLLVGCSGGGLTDPNARPDWRIPGSGGFFQG